MSLGAGKKRGAGSGGAGAGGGWSAEYLEQHSGVSPKQADLLKQSFGFLHAAQEALDQRSFYKLVKALVDYDKGGIEVTV
jgi:hypothetical protein